MVEGTRSAGVETPPEEIHIGLVRPLGTDVAELCDHIAAALSVYGFTTYRIKLSILIESLVTGLPGKETGVDYYSSHMDAGDKLRETHGGGTLARLAVRQVIERRAEHIANDRGKRAIFIYDSLMHPDEVDALRQIYGDSLFVVAIHADENFRLPKLRQKLLTGGNHNANQVEQLAIDLLARDAGRLAGRARLSFEKTFKKADVFLDGERADRTVGGPDDQLPGESDDPVVRRFLRQIFSYPFGTPTRDEFAMSVAYAAARRSAALSRRVGAASTTEEGEILATGCNDVPAAAGGLYWADDEHDDQRDYAFKYLAEHFAVLTQEVQGADSNDLVKLEMLRDLMNRAREAGVVTADAGTDLMAAMLAHDETRAAQFFELITYGRTVHAEMDVITTCARLGITLRDTKLFSTTFPCHECARLIVASGIKEVIYVEPYPKSRVAQLHPDSVQVVGAPHPHDDRRVVFRPFIGISPLRQDQLFSEEARKHDEPEDPAQYGHALAWSANERAPLRQAVFGDQTNQTIRQAAILNAEDVADKAATLVIEAATATDTNY